MQELLRLLSFLRHLTREMRFSRPAIAAIALTGAASGAASIAMIALLDEWAADQDPIFKEIFYRDLLPELRARGKTVFVISHDDHYFEVADRIIKLDYGKVESDLTISHEPVTWPPVPACATAAS